MRERASHSAAGTPPGQPARTPALQRRYGGGGVVVVTGGGAVLVAGGGGGAVFGPSSTFGAGDSALSPDRAAESGADCVGSSSFGW